MIQWRRVVLVTASVVGAATGTDCYAQRNFVDFTVISVWNAAPFLSCTSTAVTPPRYIAIQSLKDWVADCKPKNTNALSELQNPKTRPVEHSFGPTDIDFNRYTLLIADVGMRGNVENILVFTQIFDARDVIVVNVMEVEAGNACISIATVNPDLRAYALIPKTDKPVRFNVSHAVEDCSKRKSGV